MWGRVKQSTIPKRHTGLYRVAHVFHGDFFKPLGSLFTHLTFHPVAFGYAQGCKISIESRQT